MFVQSLIEVLNKFTYLEEGKEKSKYILFMTYFSSNPIWRNLSSTHYVTSK
jgi:hypothetical protein